MAGTYYKKRNEFSEAHYLLPVQQGLFDIDKIKGEWLSFEINEGKEEATYVEYNMLKFANEADKRFNTDLIKYLAVFELKYCFAPRVKEAMELKQGTSSYAQFMMAKILGARFFFVVATNGLPPFSFYEYDMETGVYTELPKKLRYDVGNNTQKEACINYYWKEVVKLI